MGGIALEASGIGWRWPRWAIGWSLAYETLFAGLTRLDPAGGAALSRRAISGGPRLALQLLRPLPDVVGAARFGPTSAWGFEFFLGVGQVWKGETGDALITYGLSVLGF